MKKIKLSYEAMFFGVAWALYKQLWFHAGIMLLVYFIYPIATLVFSNEELLRYINAISGILILLSVFVFGKYGNVWVEKDKESSPL